MGLDMWIRNQDGNTDGEIYLRSAQQVFDYIEDYIIDKKQEGIENCEEYKLPRILLEELWWVCCKINEDNSLADKLLPEDYGIGFGPQYEKEYYIQVEELEQELYRLLNERENDEYFYFIAWW